MSMRLLALSSLLLAIAIPEAAAQQPAVTVTEEEPGLLAKATISPDSATKLARAQVPTATIETAEIEMEDGRLIYSFDMKLPNKSGLEEVELDAKTGKVLKVEHEDAAAESRETQEDSTKDRP